MDRQAILAEIIKTQRVGSQEELLKLLAGKGVFTTQSSVSRDLRKLSVTKAGGAYRLPAITPGESPLVQKLEAISAGDHLIVLKTGPGDASRAGYTIDQASFSEVAGTIAGDDTIFIALRDKADQPKALRKIFDLFKN